MFRVIKPSLRPHIFLKFHSSTIFHQRPTVNNPSSRLYSKRTKNLDNILNGYVVNFRNDENDRIYIDVQESPAKNLQRSLREDQKTVALEIIQQSIIDNTFDEKSVLVLLRHLRGEGRYDEIIHFLDFIGRSSETLGLELNKSYALKRYIKKIAREIKDMRECQEVFEENRQEEKEKVKETHVHDKSSSKDT